MFAVSWLHSNQISYCINGLILWCDGPWESTVPPAEPHILLSVVSHCTIEQVWLSMGIHCPPRGLISDRSAHLNVPWDRWDCGTPELNTHFPHAIYNNLTTIVTVDSIYKQLPVFTFTASVIYR